MSATPVTARPIGPKGLVVPKEASSLAQVMTLSAACALASGGASAAAAKMIAAVAGPAAIGAFQTLQQLREAALTCATANGGTALAQGASTFSGGAHLGTAWSEYVRTVAWIFAAATTLASAALVLAPGAVARWCGLTVSDAASIRGLIPAVILSSAYVFLTALLKALGASRRLALLQLAGPGAMAALAWPAARTGHFAALLGASGAATVIAAALALAPFRLALTSRLGWEPRAPSLWAARHFLAVSGAMLATSLAGSAALLTVRASIVRSQGLAGVGQFDAAWGISMSQVSLVLASLQTHYLPALARAVTPEARRASITRVLTLAAPPAALAIAVLALAKPFWLGLLYSAEFHPAARYLRWTLAGDYLKVTSWILTIPMLARADLFAFVGSDLAAVAAFLMGAGILARRWNPAEAAAIAYVAMHAVHLAAGTVYVIRREGPLWSALGPWLAGLALVVGVSLWKWNA